MPIDQCARCGGRNTGSLNQVFYFSKAFGLLCESLKYISPNEFEKKIEVEYQDGKSAGRPKLKL
jgi:hypothetical protein